MRRLIVIPVSALALLLGLTACSSPGGGGADALPVGENAIVIDVRTPGEYAEGHLEGAELLDFTAGDLAAALPGLDPGAEYLVYCRSGNRSGQAIALMEQAGFTNLVNLGSLEQAARATGLEIVR